MTAAINRGEARGRILDTAEELFAENGVEAVSLRTINSAAGVSPGVLHYHFGSREVLVHELINRHMQQLWATRAEMLAPLMAEERPCLRSIMHSLVDPLARLALEKSTTDQELISPGARYVKFIARLYSDRSPALVEASEPYRETQKLYPQLLRKALPELEPGVIDLKFAMANHAMLQALVDLNSPGRSWLSSQQASMAKTGIVTILVDFLTGGMSPPPDERTT